MSNNRAVLDVIEDHLTGTWLSDSARVRFILGRLRQLFPPYFSESVSVVKREHAGLGVVSTKGISKGELVLIDHPVISLTDIDLAASEYSELDGGDSLGLLEAICSNYSSSVEECFRNLYPIRTNSTTEEDIELPEELLEKLSRILPSDISPSQFARAVQLNSLGYYTFPELVTYGEGLRFLSGTGIYPKGSMFNHSCSPNINHYSIGDVTFFRALNDIEQGEELFISYIGRDLLVESKSVRDEFLDSRDFECTCTKCTEAQSTEDPWLEELDLSTRVQLKLLKSHEDRIGFIRRTLAEHDYISRDIFELQFALARELGVEGLELWDELLRGSEDSIDMQSIVVRMHYLRIFGNSDSVESNIREIGRVLLGKEIGCFDFIQSLFTLTDFN